MDGAWFPPYASKVRVLPLSQMRGQQGAGGALYSITHGFKSRWLHSSNILHLARFVKEQ